MLKLATTSPDTATITFHFKNANSLDKDDEEETPVPLEAPLTGSSESWGAI